jgi:hypothetical protein
MVWTWDKNRRRNGHFYLKDVVARHISSYSVLLLSTKMAINHLLVCIPHRTVQGHWGQKLNSAICMTPILPLIEGSISKLQRS